MGDAEYDDMDGPGWGEYGPGEEGEVEYEDVPFEDDEDEGPVNMVSHSGFPISRWTCG